MKRLFTLAILVIGMTIPATTHAGSPGTTADAYASVKLYYSQLVRESAYVNTRVTYACHTTLERNTFTCRTRLFAGTTRRLRVVTDWLIFCDGSRFCWINKRLYTWRYS